MLASLIPLLASFRVRGVTGGGKMNQVKLKVLTVPEILLAFKSCCDDLKIKEAIIEKLCKVNMEIEAENVVLKMMNRN